MTAVRKSREYRISLSFPPPQQSLDQEPRAAALARVALAREPLFARRSNGFMRCRCTLTEEFTKAP
jgi:hypothetical protein